MVDVTAADELDPWLAEEQVLQQLPLLETDPIEPRNAEEHGRMVHEQNGRGELVGVDLRAHPLDLGVIDQTRHLAGHLGVEPEAEHLAGSEREGDALRTRAPDPVVEGRAQACAILVVPRYEPQAVVPRPQDLPDRLVGDGQLVVSVISGDDEMIDAARVFLDVRNHLEQQLTRWDAEQPLVGVFEDMEVGQLHDPGHGHFVASLPYPLTGRRHLRGRRWGVRPGTLPRR